MSLLKSNSVQIGQSATATQNFTLSVPSSPDGTIKLARGNSGATTADVLTVDASGNVTTTLASGSVKFSQLSTSATEADNAAKRVAKAWVNFNGANAFSPNPSTSAIRASFNVSSITKGGTGEFTVNFTSAMADANYSALATCSQNLSSNPQNFSVGYPDNSSLDTYSTTQLKVLVKSGSSQQDPPCISIAIFGN